MTTWHRYNHLKRQIEAGTSHDWATLRRLQAAAEAESRRVAANWRALGLINR